MAATRQDSAFPVGQRNLDLLRDRYYAGFGGAVVGGLAMSCFMVLAFWSQSNRLGLVAWIVANALSLLAAIALRSSRQQLLFGKWLRQATLVELSQGFVWGGIAIVAMPQNATSQAFLVAVQATVLLAGSVTSSQFRRCFLAYSIPLAALAVTGLAWRGAEGTWLLITLILVTFAFGVGLSADQRTLQVQLIGALADNQQLVADLKVGQDELTASNHALLLAKNTADRVARTDQLTGLANRYGFDRRIQQVSQAMAEGHHEAVTLAFFDLDKFKQVNDMLGHHAGDILLHAVAERLLASANETDYCARVGGDELVVLSTSPATDEIGNRIVSLFRNPLTAEGHTFKISVSVGVATVFAPFQPDDLLSRADIAQYEAKRSGGDSYIIWSPELSHPRNRSLSEITANAERA